MKKLFLILLPLIALSAYGMENPHKRKHAEFYEHDLMTAVRSVNPVRVRELAPRVSKQEIMVALDEARRQNQIQHDPTMRLKIERIVEILEFYR